MDQEAFRSLLNAPRPNGQASSSRGRAVLGGPPPKRTGWGLKPKEGYEKKHEPPTDSRPAFTPRAHQKKVNDVRYKDRAEMRRQGGQDEEYKTVEQLLEDFERRKAEAGDQAEKVEETRQYLGGDAKHSVLVKGLDFALLAARKAELEREKASGMDDELDELARGIEANSKVKTNVSELGSATGDREINNKFKSIAQKKAESEAAAATAVQGEKKKKKKKKVKRTDAEEVLPPKVSTVARDFVEGDHQVASLVAPSSTHVTPPDPEDEEDIFADVGGYDLNVGREDADEDEDEGGVDSEEAGMIVDDPGESRSRSPSRHRRYSRSQSRSPSREIRHDRGYHRHDGSRDRDTRDHANYREYRDGDRYDRNRGERWNKHEDRRASYYQNDTRRSPESSRRNDSRYESRYERERYDRRDRQEYSRQEYSVERRRRSSSRSHSPHRSPKRFQRSLTPVRPTRARSRSPTPLLQSHPIPYSRSPSPSSDDDDGPVTRLKPLASSAIADVRSFLESDEAGAKDDARRLRKAKWRAQQGLGMQEGIQADQLKKDVGDKQKANRDYVMVMNTIKKGEASGGGKGGEK